MKRVPVSASVLDRLIKHLQIEHGGHKETKVSEGELMKVGKQLLSELKSIREDASSMKSGMSRNMAHGIGVEELNKRR